MAFRTQYQRERVSTCSGEQMQPVYKLQYTDDGAQDLMVVGQENLYESIQSWKDSCDLQTIIARYNAGDTSVLSVGNPLFGDFTGLPNSTAGFLQLLADAENSFSQLPLEQRAAFDNSPHKFFASIGKPEFFEKMGIVKEKPVPEKEKPVPEVVVSEKEVKVDES